MFRTTVGILIALLTAALAAGAPAPSVRSVTLCLGIAEPGMKPVDPRDRFTADAAEIHAVVRLERVAESCSVRGAWISIDAIDVPNYEIAATDVAIAPEGDPSAHFSISRPGRGWPTGNYEFQVSSGGALLRAVPFAITPATAAAGTKSRARPGTTFRHPSGLAFWMPTGWTSETSGTVVRLAPPAGGDGGATFVVMSPDTEIADLAAADDARLAKEIDEGVRDMLPGVRPVATGTKIATALGAGVVLDWANPEAGEGLTHVRAWVAVDAAQHRPVALFAFTHGAVAGGLNGGLDDELRAIFCSGARGEPVAPTEVVADALPPGDAAPKGAADADVQRKLDALDRARDAGVLSDDEYRRKRAELLPAAPAIDAATQKKLDALEAARQAGVLSDAEFAAKKAELLGGRGGTAAPKPAGEPPAAAGDGSTLRRVVAATKGKTWRHPVGFSMWYPAEWTLTEHAGFLQLAPADAEKNAEGPLEYYFVAGETVAGTGITDPASAEVAQYLDGQIQSLAPFLQRRAAPRSLGTDAGRGALLEWEGANPRGDTILARAHVCIVREFAVSLISLGHKKPLEKRGADVARIFASFRLGEGQRDAALAGTWSFLETRTLTNNSQNETAWSRARMASDSSSSVTLRADGTWTRTTRRHMIAGAGGVWIEDDSTKTDKGTWFAADGKLNLLGEGNAWEEYTYRVNRTAEGTQLVLVSGGNQEFWARTQ